MEKEKLERKQKMLFSIKFKLKVREKENNVACWLVHSGGFLCYSQPIRDMYILLYRTLLYNSSLLMLLIQITIVSTIVESY